MTFVQHCPVVLVNQWQSKPHQHNTWILYVLYLYFSMACFGHSFDYHQVKVQVQKGKVCYWKGLHFTISLIKYMNIISN